MKKSEKRDVKLGSWIMTGLYWIIGCLNFVLGGIKNYHTGYGWALLIVLLLPLLLSLALTVGMKPIRLINNVLMAIAWLVLTLAIGISYRMQDPFGWLLVIGFLLLYSIIAAILTLVSVLRHRKAGKYFVEIDGAEDQASGFSNAYWQYFVYYLLGGLIEVLGDMIFS